MRDAAPSALAANPRQVMLVGAGALVLAAALFALWFFMLRTPMVPAFTDLKAADAALIADELKRQKLPYELADGGKTILVPRDAVDSARISILGRDLPLKGTVGFELFSKSDMGLTEFAQKINYQRALQGELARTLMSLSEIETARVHITLPKAGIFEDNHRPAKASVTLVPKRGATIDAPAIIGIQHLVASAVEDLDDADVVVIDGSGKQLSAEVSDRAASGGSAIERFYADAVRDAALQLLDDPAMRVTVRAPLDATVPPPMANATGAPRRSFPLHITVRLGDQADAGLRNRLAARLESTIGYDPATGDTLRLIARAADVPPAAKPVASAAFAGAAADRVNSGQVRAWQWFLWGLVGAAAVAAAAFFVRRARPRRRLSEAERLSFASRLRDLLDEEERLSGGTA